jgi:hypothetical protein
VQEREPWLGVGAEPLGLAEGLVRGVELAHPQAYLTELVEGLAREVGGELREFPARHLSLGVRLAQRPEEPHDLGPADAADAGESRDCLPLAPALSCVQR